MCSVDRLGAEEGEDVWHDGPILVLVDLTLVAGPPEHQDAVLLRALDLFRVPRNDGLTRVEHVRTQLVVLHLLGLGH